MLRVELRGVKKNGLGHFRLLMNRPVTWRLDTSAERHGHNPDYGQHQHRLGFASFVFVAYYPALALFCPASTIFAGWRQSVLPVHLLGLDALLGCVGALAGAVKLQDDGVMDHPINRRRGGHGVGEDAFPLREDQV